MNPQDPADGRLPNPLNDTATAALAVAAPVALALAIVALAGVPRPFDVVVIAVGVATAVWATLRYVVQPLRERAERERSHAEAAAFELLDERAMVDIHEQLDHKLRNADSEPAALRHGLTAVAALSPGTEVSLLLSLTDQPKVGWRIRLADGAVEGAEQVPNRPSCGALRSGRTLVLATSSGLNACEHLKGSEGDVSSVCVPLFIGDHLLGSVSVEGPAGEPPDARTVGQLEWAVERVGRRIAEHRLQRQTESGERSDPATGLPSAAAFRVRLGELVRSFVPFCVAVIEPDEPLGGTDDLRVVGSVLTSTLRPDDFVCRLDDRRLAAVLTQCSGDQAVAAIGRVRTALAEAGANAGRDAATASTGLAESYRISSLEAMIDQALDACARASQQGGDRVVVAGAEQPSGL